MQEKKIAIEYPDGFIKKVMAHQASRQEKATSHLGPEGREIIARLDSFFWKVILVVGRISAPFMPSGCSRSTIEMAKRPGRLPCKYGPSRSSRTPD